MSVAQALTRISHEMRVLNIDPQQVKIKLPEAIWDEVARRLMAELPGLLTDQAMFIPPAGYKTFMFDGVTVAAEFDHGRRGTTTEG